MTDDERIVREHKQKLAQREKQRRAAAMETVRDPRTSTDPEATKRSSSSLDASIDDVPLIEAQDVRHGLPPIAAKVVPQNVPLTRPTTPMFKRPAKPESMHGSEGVDEDADSEFDAPRKSDTEVAGDPDAPTALGGTNWRAAVLMALNHLESANAQLREVDDARAQVANADLALAYRALADVLKENG